MPLTFSDVPLLTRMAIVPAALFWACAGAPPQPLSKGVGSTDDCGLARAAELDRLGQLDAALTELARCPASPPAVLTARMEILIELGDLAEAQRTATELQRVDPLGSRRTSEVLHMKAEEEQPEAARERANAALSARAKGDAPSAARAFSQARHILGRITHATPEPVLLSSPSPLGWAADTPLWDVIVQRPTHSDAARACELAMGEIHRESQTVTLARITEGREGFPGWAAWPAHPGWFVVATSNGVQLYNRTKLVLRLPARGAPIFSPTGDVLLVAGKTAIDSFATASWTKQATVAIHAEGDGAWTKDGAIYAELTHERALLLDPRAGRVLLDREVAASALSDSAERLAVLYTVPDPRTPWALDLYDVRALDQKPRAVRLPIQFVSGPVLTFDADRVVRIGEHDQVAHGDYHDVDRALVDIATAKQRPLPQRTPKDDLPHFAALAHTSHVRVSKALAAFVKKPRVALDADSFVQVYAESGQSGLLAAGVGTVDHDFCGGLVLCLVRDPSVFLVDESRHALLSEVKIPANKPFAITFVALSPDEHTVLVCGSEGGSEEQSFVIDVGSGAIEPIGSTVCSSRQFDVTGSMLLLEGTVVELDHSAPRPWPGKLSIELAPDAALKQLEKGGAVSAGTPGLFCRFGELLMPYELCLPPSPNMGQG